VFTETLKSAIMQVSGECAGDLSSSMSECGEDDLDFAYCLAEVTLDGGRLGMFGHPEAQRELEKLLETNSFSDICEAAKSIVCY